MKYNGDDPLGRIRFREVVEDEIRLLGDLDVKLDTNDGCIKICRINGRKDMEWPFVTVPMAHGDWDTDKISEIIERVRFATVEYLLTGDVNADDR